MDDQAGGRPVDGIGQDGADCAEALLLTVTDPEVVTELRRHARGLARQQFALSALRVGVLSVRAATGQIDASAVREAGGRLIGDLQTVLAQRAAEFTGEMTRTLAQYFDPATGVAAQRFERLVQKDGDLERVLRSHIGDESTMARTLVAHMGATSPLFRLLSPADPEGLKAQVEAVLATELRAQAEQVLAQFSLDVEDSALSRMVKEIKVGHTELGAGFQASVETVVKEFSLDRPESALSRLVAQVDGAQKRITDEFSLDNKLSAMSRLQATVTDATARIDRHLTLDDEQSPLSRMQRELRGVIQDAEQRRAAFETQVTASIATLTAQRAERARGTLHGADFEQAVGDLLASEAQRQGDVYASVGSEAGAISRCKVGDHVITMGPDSPAPGVNLVFEAKEDHAYDVKKAVAELDTARKNREAQVGIFVFSSRTAPPALERFQRYGDGIVVVWDAEDATTDVYVKAAYSLARALAIREQVENAATAEAVAEIEATVRAVERHVKRAGDIKRFAETAHSATDKIIKEAAKLESDLESQVADLDEQVASLKVGGE